MCAYCLWRRSKSPMQSNLPPPTLLFPPPVSFTIIIYLFCRTPHHVSHYTNPFATSVNSFCHALSSTKHHAPPASTSLDISIFLFLSLISHSFVSNDIYAILIEYLLYMRLHIYKHSPFFYQCHPSHSRLVAVSMLMA